MDFFSFLWIASLVIFIAGPTLAGIAYRKEKIPPLHALVAALLALVISALLSWALIFFSV